MPSRLPPYRLDLLCVQTEMRLLERRAVACGHAKLELHVLGLYCVVWSGWFKAAEGRAHGRPCIWGFLQRDLARACGLQQEPGTHRDASCDPLGSSMVAPRLLCTLQPLRSLRVGFWKSIAASTSGAHRSGLDAALGMHKKGFKADRVRSQRFVFECGGWWESWTWSWSDDRPTLLGAKNGQETACPIMHEGRDGSRVSVRHRNPPADSSCDGAGFQTRSRRASGCHRE
jgi:hypothetical protein